MIFIYHTTEGWELLLQIHWVGGVHIKMIKMNIYKLTLENEREFQVIESQKLTFFYRFLVDGTSGKKIDFLANAFREKINKFIISN